MKSLFLAGAVALALGASSWSITDDDREGHPHHEQMTEVEVGTVHFPTSCSATVQKSIERGVAMLHSFWYEEAEKQFVQVEKDDSNCAIAHWGVTMSDKELPVRSCCDLGFTKAHM